MTGCAAVGCSNKSGKGIKLYRFPRDPERRKIWAKNVAKKNWEPKDSSVLCKEHFEPSEYERYIPTKLRCTAIPTIFGNRKVKRRKDLQELALERLRQNQEVDLPQKRLLLEHAYITYKDPDLPSAITNQSPEPQSIGDTTKTEVEATNLETERIVITPLIFSNTDSNDTDLEAVGPSPGEITEHEQEENPESIIGHEEPIFLISSVDSLARSCESVGPSQDATADQLARIQYLEKRLEKTDLMLRVTRRINTVLRGRLYKANKTIETNENGYDKFLRPDQLQFLRTQKNRCTKWSDETVQESRKILDACGKKGYEHLLRLNYPLPSLRVLRRKQVEEETKITITPEYSDFVRPTDFEMT